MVCAASFLLACLCACALTETVAIYSPDSAPIYFDDFITKFDKHYLNDTDKEAHYLVFKNNLETVNQLNQESNGHGAIFGITKYMDLGRDEYKRLVASVRHGVKGGIISGVPICEILGDNNLTAEGAPDSFDWRTRNVITSVKDQRTCNACYAFSAIGLLESQYAIKYKKLMELSPQQIIDCDTKSWGCQGGEMSDAFKTVMILGGSMKEADYPFNRVTGNCLSSSSKAVVKISKCSQYNITSQEKLKQWLYKIGPITVAVQSKALAYYTGGIITDAQCDKGEVDHAVLLVGYGTENGTQYWLAKNSQGVYFGEDGYFRMHRGEGAKSCGMMNDFMATAEIE